MRRPHAGCGRSSPLAAYLLAAWAICVQFATVLAGDTQTSKDDNKAGVQSKARISCLTRFSLAGLHRIFMLL
ncbi:hypothetical protein GUJ93_ZPchr0155g7013 [Zizania palustris]|uniref:Secreted protein n=1 Tax=Zizania palustris TaxID=103762 RepID=A0A8J5RQQ4_ZIZPA|nr:hypothetical protein GUJ93_ZPchr0155g7013 [Zizania palustris]